MGWFCCNWCGVGCILLVYRVWCVWRWWFGWYVFFSVVCFRIFWVDGCWVFLVIWVGCWLCSVCISVWYWLAWLLLFSGWVFWLGVYLVRCWIWYCVCLDIVYCFYFWNWCCLVSWLVGLDVVDYRWLVFCLDVSFVFWWWLVAVNEYCVIYVGVVVRGNFCGNVFVIGDLIFCVWWFFWIIFRFWDSW